MQLTPHWRLLIDCNVHSVIILIRMRKVLSASSISRHCVSDVTLRCWDFYTNAICQTRTMKCYCCFHGGLRDHAEHTTSSCGIRNKMALDSNCTCQPELRRRSLFNLVHVYNALPQSIVNCISISDFQHELTEVARKKLHLHHNNWRTFLAARHFDPSRQLFGF